MTDAIEIFGRDQVERSVRYHRPLYAGAAGNLALGLALLVTLAFTSVSDLLFDPVRGVELVGGDRRLRRGDRRPWRTR